MEFPQLMFLPARVGLLDVDSLLRLDELQSVFTPHLEASEFSLGDEVAANFAWSTTLCDRSNRAYTLHGIAPTPFGQLINHLIWNTRIA